MRKAVACKLLIKKEVASLENIVTTIEVIYMTIIIIDSLKVFIDWYVDYRLDKREKENKNRRSGKNER